MVTVKCGGRGLRGNTAEGGAEVRWRAQTRKQKPARTRRRTQMRAQGCERRRGRGRRNADADSYADAGMQN